MPLLDHTKLGSMDEWKRAHMVLSAIGNGYVWQNGVQEPVKVSNLCMEILRMVLLPQRDRLSSG